MIIENVRAFQQSAKHGVGVRAVGGECLVRADQQVHGEDEPFGDSAADGVAAAGWFLAGAQDHHQVQVAVVVFFAAGDTPEENDLLGVEAVHDELGDGLDGLAVEGVLDDAHRARPPPEIQCRRRRGRSCRRGLGLWCGSG